jgi:hypothetical protein
VQLGSRATRGVLGTVADALAVATFLAACAALVSGQPVSQAVLATFLCLLCAALLGLVLTSELQFGRRVRQSLAFPTFAQAIGSVAHATYALRSGGSPDAFVGTLEKALDRLADAYGNASGVPCRATVQMTYPPDEPHRRGDLGVRTVARSGGDNGRRRGVDWVNDNTDFRHVLDGHGTYFFCNDLMAALSRGYRNSHFTEDDIRTGRLPYLATVVWPVRAHPPDAAREWELIGFVCVDACHAGTFDEAVDVAPGAAFADALYPGLSQYRDVTSTQRTDAGRSTHVATPP